MTVAFDTLAYSKRLRAVAVDEKVADAHAEAIRDLVVADNVTRGVLQAELGILRTEMSAQKAELRAEIASLGTELRSDMDLRFARVDTRFAELETRLTFRLGAIVIACTGALFALLRLT